MITIEKERLPVFVESMNLQRAGFIRLSNWVEIWFGDLFPVKTVEEARLLADRILTELNKYEYAGFDLIGDNKVYLNYGYNSEFEYNVHINDIYDFIVEYGMNEYYISEDETRRTPVDQVLAENPDIYETYFNEIVLPKIKNETAS